MKAETPLILISTAAILLFGIVSSLLIAHRPVAAVAEEASGSWACAADYQECPDGSSVGRVPPYCLFAACGAATHSIASN